MAHSPLNWLQGMATTAQPNGAPVQAYGPALPPYFRTDERLEWVRKSYELFIEKVLELDPNFGQMAVELS